MPAATGLGLASSGAWRAPPGVARGPVGVALLREWGAGPGMTRHPRWTHRATTPTCGRCGLGPAYVREAVLPKVRLAPCDPLATRCPSVALGGLRADTRRARPRASGAGSREWSRFHQAPLHSCVSGIHNTQPGGLCGSREHGEETSRRATTMMPRQLGPHVGSPQLSPARGGTRRAPWSTYPPPVSPPREDSGRPGDLCLRRGLLHHL